MDPYYCLIFSPGDLLPDVFLVLDGEDGVLHLGLPPPGLVLCLHDNSICYISLFH